MGIGDWGLGIGDWGLGPIPNPPTPIPQPPNPNPHPLLYNKKKLKIKLNKKNYINLIELKMNVYIEFQNLKNKIDK